MKIRHVSFLSLFLCLLIINPLCASAGIPEGIAYLAERQNDNDFSWSNGARKYLDTYTAVEALHHIGVTDGYVSDGAAWVAAVSSTLVDDLARQASVLALFDLDNETKLNSLLAVQNTDGGFGFKEKFPSSLIDSLLAAKVLTAAGVDDQDIIGRVLFYLTENQNGNGSFGFAAGGDGSLYVTALAIPILYGFQPKYDLSEHISEAVAFVRLHEHVIDPDMIGFGEDNPAVIDTALAVRALQASGVSAAVINNARTYLLSEQDSGGSWDNDTYATSLALWALKDTENIDNPNLVIDPSSLVLTPVNPVDGQTVTLSCTVKNTGTLAADAGSGYVTVAVSVDGEEAVRGTVPAIAAGEEISTELSWVLEGVIGQRDIYVQADPDGVITESSVNDNTAMYGFTSSEKADLAVSASEITFDNSAPHAGEQFTMSVVVRNMGETDAAGVTVDVYNGNPDNDQFVLGLTLNEIQGGG
ncbi:MAG: hypothetical protein GY850_20715, partial [bacterium]|nr:hypothetical protein [bacterium]